MAEGPAEVLQDSSIERWLPTSLKRPWQCWLSPEIIAGTVAATDFCLVVAAAMAAFRVYEDAMGDPQPGRYIITTLFAATVFVVWLERVGGYKFKQAATLGRQLAQLLLIWAGTVSLLLLIAFVGKISENYSRGWSLGAILGAAGLLCTSRCIVRLAVDRWVRDGSLARHIAIVGAGNEGQLLIRKLQASNDPSFVICGIFDDRKSRVPPLIHGLEVLGTTDDLIQFARRDTIDEVIVALPLNAEERLKKLLDKLQGIACDLRLSADSMVQNLVIQGMSFIGDVPVLTIADRPLKNWGYVTKWIEDKVLAIIFLIFLLPVLGLIALVIKLDSRGPIFFLQKRFGFNNEVIEVIKFRTMHIHHCDNSGAARTTKGDPRVTRVGRLLRRLSLDELPQLMNVLRGDMSLVGPRPHAIAMKAGDSLYCDAVEQYLHRHRVRPGITGWAQVNGLRGEVDTLAKARARVEHDLYYIKHWSLWLDLKIILRTLVTLSFCKNAY